MPYTEGEGEIFEKVLRLIQDSHAAAVQKRNNLIHGLTGLLNHKNDSVFFQV